MNELPTPRFAGPIFTAWTIGIPLLAWGFSTANEPMIVAAALSPLAAVGVVATKEGSTCYDAGDYLVYNEPEDGEAYAVEKRCSSACTSRPSECG